MESNSQGQAAIAPLELEEMAPALREVIAPRVERLGYLGDFFRYTRHQPAALAAALNYAGSLREAVPARLAEIVVLTVSAQAGNRYEQVQHEPLALRAGLTRVEIRALVDGGGSSPASFDAADLATLALAALAQPRGATRAAGWRRSSRRPPRQSRSAPC